MTLEQKTNHVDEAKAMFVQQFRGKPDLEALLTSFIAQVQDLENVYFQLLENRWLDTASGVQLDGIGKIVGLERLGLDDGDYRAALRAQIRLNLSSGTIPDNTTILELLITNSYRIVEWFPAAFNVVVSDEFTEDPENIAKRISKAAGVKAFLEYTLTEDAKTFQFASGDTIESDMDAGFSDEIALNGSFDAWTADDPDDWTVLNEGGGTREVSEVGSGESHGGTGTGSCNIWRSGSPGTEVSIRQIMPAVAGTTYRLTIVVSYVSGSGVYVEDVSGAAFGFSLNSLGTYELDFAAGAAFVGLMITAFDNSEMTIDTISVGMPGGDWADVVEV